MLGDTDNPKILGDNSPLEAEWHKQSYKAERKEMWWERDTKAKFDRNFSGSFVNIFYTFLLVTEVILWVKVMLIWRQTSVPTNAVWIILPLLLPSLCLPVLAVLHSLTKGRLSYSSACLLVLPPAPICLHLLIFYRKLQGEDHSRLSRAVRAAGFVQSLVTSLPLIVFSLVTMLQATVGEERVDMSDMHRHLFSHSLQGLAATVSFLNLVISSLRFNERDTGRAVSLLVGFPFLLTNIGFRLLGFSLLFCYFDTVWIFLCLGLLFCISALSVQLAARESLCVRLCRSMVGDQPSNNTPGKDTVMDGVAGMVLISVANVLVPCGYSVTKRGWRLLFVCWTGSMIVHGLVMHQSIMSHVPNTYTGLAPVDMSMIIPKTGLAVNIPRIAGGVDIQLVLPRTEMQMAGEHPASYQINASHTQDLIAALLSPIMLIFITVPFTVLRMILLGWNCTLTRQYWDEEEEGLRPASASKAWNCLTVFCGVSGMMMFTMLLMILVMIYVFIFVQSFSSPLTKDPSD